MKVRGVTVPVSELQLREREAMLVLLDRHFEGVDEENFARDLSDKEVVILLRELGSDTIVGFSTQRTQRVMVEGAPMRVVFSGDTIIHPSAWGSLALPREWGKWMKALWDEQPELPLYWLLISKGYRTYRFLPAYFNEFYPMSGRQTSEPEWRVYKTVAREVLGRSGLSVDNGQKLMHFRPLVGSQSLRDELADIPSRLARNEAVTFFADRNPEYRRGTELVTITRFCESNLKPLFARMVYSPSYGVETAAGEHQQYAAIID